MLKRRKKPQEEIDKNKQETRDMHNFFLSIWGKRKHISEISGTRLGQQPLTVFFHHILEKEKYPQAKHDEENIILITWVEHDQVGLNMYYYEEINKRREKLKIKYNIQ